MSTNHLGIDIGGSGIKAAIADPERGRLVSERVIYDTPEPSTPEAVEAVVAKVVSELDYRGPVGVGFPSVITGGVARTANNIDKSWIGTSVLAAMRRATGTDEVVVANDADAAAVCEARFGAAKGVEGLVILLTFGSGIGSGFLAGGNLVPNTELGVLELDGHYPAELHFSAKARKRDQISWPEWGVRANRFLTHVHELFTPELIVVGGGASWEWDTWHDQISPNLPVVRAQLVNDAGIMGAAILGHS